MSIKNWINNVLGKNRMFIISAEDNETYAQKYYAVEASSQNAAYRKVTELDKDSSGYKLVGIIDEDVIITSQSPYYVHVVASPVNKNILITAPHDTVENIIKYKYEGRRSCTIFGIHLYEITKILH